MDKENAYVLELAKTYWHRYGRVPTAKVEASHEYSSKYAFLVTVGTEFKYKSIPVENGTRLWAEDLRKATLAACEELKKSLGYWELRHVT